MKMNRALISVCAACAAVLLLSSCGREGSRETPPQPGEAEMRKILQAVTIPRLIAEDFGAVDASKYSTASGRVILFDCSKPRAEKDAPERVIDYLRISRECELGIIEYRVESLKFGPVKQNKQQQWTCSVNYKIEKCMLPCHGACVLEKGFPLNWAHLPASARQEFFETDDLHDEKFDLCFLYEQFRNAELPVVKESRDVLEVVYDAAKKEWAPADNDPGKGSQDLIPLDPVLADFSQSRLVEYYRQKGVVLLRSEQDPETNSERAVFCDKTAAEYHDRQENKGQIFEESTGKWVDYEEKRQSETLREKFAAYKRNEMSAPDFLQTLNACPKATMRDSVIQDLKADILKELERLIIPTEKNRKDLELLARYIKTVPDLREELEMIEERISQFNETAALYKKQDEAINQHLGRLTKDFSGFLSNLEQAEDREKKLSELDEEKRKPFQPFLKGNKSGVNKALAYLASIDCRRSLPSLDSITEDFFKENGISHRPFGQKEYRELQTKFIEEAMAKHFPISLKEELALLKSQIEADKRYCAPKIGDVITVTCKTGPFAGRDVTGKFYGTSKAGIMINHNQLHWSDLAESRSRFDPGLDTTRKEQAFEEGRKRLLGVRNAYWEEMSKSPELPKLRRTWAWKAGWLLGPGSSYTSLKDLFARWYAVAEQQHALAVEQDALIRKGKDDWARLRGAKENDPCAKYVFALLCLKKLTLLKNEETTAEACSELQQAAEQNVILAQSFLGRLYLTGGHGLEKSSEQAFFWLKKAADQGEPQAISQVAYMLENGIGTRADRDAAAKYRAAAESLGLQATGPSARRGRSAEDKESGKKIPSSNKKIRDLLRRAEQGDAEAQSDLGFCYFNGDGVPRSMENAVTWWREAAEQGNVIAQFCLGACYEEGSGVSKDMQEAVKWYRKAADQGFEEAKKWLRKNGY